MTDPFFQLLHGWQSFYQMMGEASATLIGLMFIAAGLGTRLIDDKSDPRLRTFVTPTVIYFSVVLLVSALMNVPTLTLTALLAALAAAGLFAAVYSASHLPRLRDINQKESVERRAWLWNLLLPLFASLWLLGSALILRRFPEYGLDAAAVGVMLFLVIGLHNAWDVTLRLVSLSPP